MDPTQRRSAFDGLAASARRVLLISAHVLFREALAHVLNGEPDLWVVGQTATLEESSPSATPAALASVADVVVIERRNEDIANVVSGLRASNPRASVLVLDGERGARGRPYSPEAGVIVLPARHAALAEIIGAVHGLAEAGVAGRR